MNSLEYTEMLQPVLKSIYNDLSCNDNECHFNTTCDKVQKMGTSIDFSISADEQHYVRIQVKLEDYLIDGRKQWGKDTDICYSQSLLLIQARQLMLSPHGSLEAWSSI